MGLFMKSLDSKAEVTASRQIAKARLKSALMQEHMDMPPQLIDLLSADMVKTFKKYLNVKDNGIEINWIRKKEMAVRSDYLEIIARIPIVEKNQA